MVAFYLDEDFSFVLDGVLDSEKHIMLLESFTTPGGCNAIIFNSCERSLPSFGKKISYNVYIHVIVVSVF